MEGGSLEARLANTKMPVLQWRQRVQILLHAARGLVYMHSLSPCVVHRDVKCANVLLTAARGDEELLAKVSDFGTVRMNMKQQEGLLRTSQCTHASTENICGTQPYVSILGAVLFDRPSLTINPTPLDASRVSFTRTSEYPH